MKRNVAPAVVLLFPALVLGACSGSVTASHTSSPSATAGYAGFDYTTYGLPNDPWAGVDTADDEALRIAYVQQRAQTTIGVMTGFSNVNLTGLDLSGIPDMPLVAYSAGPADPHFNDCMLDAGYPVDTDWSATTIDAGYLLADAECAAAYPPPPDQMQAGRPDGPEQLRQRYDYWVETVVPCLEAAGYPQEKDIPSFEVWSSAWQAAQAGEVPSGEGMWDPWFGAYPTAQPPEEYGTWSRDLQMTCPDINPADLWDN